MRTDQVLDSFRARLTRLSLRRHPALLFNPWLEGFKDHTFGGRAGPNISVINVFHELGHAAEFGPAEFKQRCFAHGFRFKRPPRVVIMGREYSEPRTMSGTQRELSTFAHQLHLMRKAGVKISDDEFMRDSARCMRFMADWWCVPGESEEDRTAFCKKEIAELYAKLSGAEVLSKLESWLDKSFKRLKRDSAVVNPEYHRVDHRYHVSGGAYISSFRAKASESCA